jgi:hypothetical protein
MTEKSAGLPGLPTLWLPDWLYESLPVVYLVAGLATIIHFESPAGYGAGALLLLAAILILKMRRDYRAVRETVRLARELTDYSQNVPE